MHRPETYRHEGTPELDERAKADLINAEVDRYLQSGVETSAQRAAERAIADEAVLYHRYERRVGNYAEEIIERTLDELLGPKRILEAPLTVDRTKPRRGENSLGKGQADFFVVLDPEGRERLGVQVFMHRLGRTEPGRGRTDAEVLRQKITAAYEQAYVRGAEGAIIPLTLLHPNADVIWRAFTEWETHERQGTPAHYVPPKEKERLALDALEQMRRVLANMAAYHRNNKKLVAAYQTAQEKLAVLKRELDEHLRQKKTGGPKPTLGPPAPRSEGFQPDAFRPAA
ncbi:hypothetical protein HY442_01005 [Candidatus Parcubacteria bacterium]|nr:hypothetical protein [Candidatus Parcubacteria bacterium]